MAIRFLLVALVALGTWPQFLNAQTCAPTLNRAQSQPAFALTASSTVTVSPSKVVPPFVSNPGLLSPGGALGYLGPLGPYGPLGILGPVGDNSWNPSTWISGWLNWASWSKNITGMGGPLTAKGPLGFNGPMTDREFYQTMPCLGDFTRQMMPAGLFSVLGPLGALGPLGPLGVLGPIGAHGFKTDTNGQYVDKAGRVQRTIRVPFDNRTSRDYDLFEKYPKAFALTQRDADTSFMAHGSTAGSTPDVYTFTSKTAQIVTILVVPIAQLDSFNINVTVTINGKQRNVISKESVYVNWVQLRVPAGTRLTAGVALSFSGHWLSKSYRLIVVGSSTQFQYTDIRGPHITAFA